MINIVNALLPELFLSLSIFFILMTGVFKKNSYNFVTNLSLFALSLIFLILLNVDTFKIKVFSDTFISDPFTNFIKILIVVSSLFILNFSQAFIKENKIDKFEYPIIILIAILGMFIMVSSNDLILFI